MTFQELLQGAETISHRGNPEIHGVQYDSRRVEAGDLFVAMRGASVDGSSFVADAVSRGAVAVISDSAESVPHPGIAWAHVAHGRRALAAVSANFFGRPAAMLKITGVTGTNGKTTTAFLLESVLAATGRGTALFGTIEYHVGAEVLPAIHTTPESLDLNRLLHLSVRARVSEAVMEVSSHALAQQRVFGLPFDVAVFTNLSQDHLDFHQNFDEYFAAKRALFAGVGSDPPRVSVLNADDQHGARLVPFCLSQGSEVVTFGVERGDFRAEQVQTGRKGVAFHLATPQGGVQVHSSLAGRVNLYNILGAAAAATARGCPLQAIQRGVERLALVPGRFEQVECGQPFAVVVDYAHTDDALRNLTSVAREFVAGNGKSARVITVFGCGGDRDRSKRPLMGEAAGRGSDFVVLSSDNPRREDPLAIMNDALVGVQKSGVRYTTEPDRRKAIALAITEARRGDIVLIAGKGHEKVQITAAGSSPFDDVAEARAALTAAGFTPDEGKTGARPVAAAGGER